MKMPKLFRAIFGRRKTTTARFHIEGMSCAGCVAKIEKAIGDLPGISSVRIDLDAGQATIDYQPNEVSEYEYQTQLHGGLLARRFKIRVSGSAPAQPAHGSAENQSRPCAES